MNTHIWRKLWAFLNQPLFEQNSAQVKPDLQLLERCWNMPCVQSKIDVPLADRKSKVLKSSFITIGILAVSISCAGAGWWLRQHSTATETPSAKILPLNAQTMVVPTQQRLSALSGGAINTITLTCRINGRVQQTTGARRNAS
jgi:hypothetical protein